MRRRVVGLVVSALALGVALGGCGDDAPATTSPREPRFAEPRPTWVQDTTLHYGRQSFEVPEAERAWRTTYGVVLALEDSRDSRYVLFDGDVTVALPGSPASLEISPDGRYAGWIDQRRVVDGDGVAQAVVTDLRTGREVVRDDRMMGQDQLEMLTELYAELPPSFAGFDAEHGYWNPPTGEPDMLRVDLATGEVSAGSAPVGDGLSGPPVRLADVGGIPQRPDWGPAQELPTRDGLSGFASVDGRWCVTDGDPGRLEVDSCEAGEPATPDYPPGQVRFLGWAGPDALTVLVWQGETPVEEGAEDTTTGVVARCELPAGACSEVARVDRTASLLGATGEAGAAW
ncbi:hypothetical protein [Nocardioides aequoreus]|uniref:hypothetical protein n=1 Tax=Nocardioides aequoreus TaxID=397278 RepID=UPI0012F6E648|nr:hypothetical protein [Nocardioides aequoreus]